MSGGRAAGSAGPPGGPRPASAPAVSGGLLLEAWEGRSADEWARRLSAATVEFHDRVGSTNDRARALVREGWPMPAVVVADRQSEGRGRRGRRWISDTPLGLWLTLVRASAGEAAGASLPLRVGLAVARGVESVVPGLRIAVKWPNDLLADGRKLGGVLCERAGEAVLAGIGLNLNQSGAELPAGLKLPATSVFLECGRSVPRGGVLAAVADALAEVWARPGPSIPAPELDELNARSPLKGRRLSVDGVVRHSSGGPRAVEALPATAGNLRADGSLEVLDDDGTRLRLIAGTIGSWR